MAPLWGTNLPRPAFPLRPATLHAHLEAPMKGILAWLIGIPIPIIILLYFVDVF